MKIKRGFKVFLGCCISMILLLSTACGYKEYAGVPKIKTIELSNGEIAISYNGSIYRKNEEITSDNISGEYFLNFEDREVVAVWNYMRESHQSLGPAKSFFLYPSCFYI